MVPVSAFAAKAAVISEVFAFKANAAFTSVAFAFNAKPAFTSVAFAFKSNAAFVAVEIGFAASDVLSTFPKPRLTRASAAVVAPVPPPAMDKTEPSLPAVSAYNA